MSTKNSLVAFLFLASPVWSQQQVAATGLQTPHKLIFTPSLARVSGPGAMAFRNRTLYPQGASSPIFVAVAADNGVPFKGTLEGKDFITPLDPPFLSSIMPGMGDATQLGQFKVVRTATVNTLTNTDIGSIAFTAANGDILTADYTGQGSTTATPGVLSIVENAFISGGTGRFAGATGTFRITRLFEFATLKTAGSFDGTISSPGAKQASLSAVVFQN